MTKRFIFLFLDYLNAKTIQIILHDLAEFRMQGYWANDRKLNNLHNWVADYQSSHNPDYL